ncbi:MAG: sialidase family protein [Verrucomicrobiales bacterium]
MVLLTTHLNAAQTPDQNEPFLTSEYLFPFEQLHNHGSCIVEAPNGDLIICWFNGSGERTADDVKIEGARLKKGSREWSARFTMADTPNYPDTNCAMFIDPQGRLWLMWPTIMANLWESALMKYRISSDYEGEGAPKWDVNEVLHVTRGPNFEKMTHAYLDQVENVSQLDVPKDYRSKLKDYVAHLRKGASDKLTRRLGWMTRAHPFVLDEKRLIVPLYSDGFSFSLMAITDDWGTNWHTSDPLIGAGNIQPSIVQKKDGSLYTLMRDNGPAPKRLQQSESKNRGETWSKVTDSDIPNPGAGSEIIGLQNGNWLLINNDDETERHSLIVQISTDEGKTWKWKRHLELDAPGPESGRYHYPSIIQAKDGTFHASYSYHLHEKSMPKDIDGDPAQKTIKHVHFNEAWVKEGDPKR